MRLFFDRHKFLLAANTALLAGLLIPTSTYASLSPSRPVILTSQADSRMISDGCQAGSQSACSIVDGDWNNQNYVCANFEVTSTALMSAIDGVLTKPSSKADNVPAFAKGCKGQILSLEHGPWVVFYSISTVCNCPAGTLPQCTGAKGPSEKACNVATYSFCGLAATDDLLNPCVVKVGSQS